MSVHQIIFTSCRRGISGGGDGKQIYSQDAAFQGADGEELRHLFSYHPPDPGCPMTDALAQTMPQAYKYQRLRSGAQALALNTYLGRDYMGETGRFGNHLSHVIVCDAQDMTAYPAEYYGGEFFRSGMTFEEVNSPDLPPILPVPVLKRCFVVAVVAVADFLSKEGHMDIYKQMLCAMLSFERTGKRVVILDEPENIILWIAALGYALPKQNAMEINFSTYEYAPARALARVCGTVRDGTELGDENQYFVFDILGRNIPSWELDPMFFGFINVAFSFPCEDLWNFHDFLSDGYDYGKADEDFYGAYALYTVLADGPGSVSEEQLSLALNFAGRFARENETLRIVRLLVEADAGIAVKLLEAFAVNAVRLTDMALTLEIFLPDSPEEMRETVWDRFGTIILSRCPASVEEVYILLSKHGRLNRAYQLYRLALSEASGPEECDAVYRGHDRALIQADPKYAALYGAKVQDSYQATRNGFPGAPVRTGSSIFQNIANLFKRRRS